MNRREVLRGVAGTLAAVAVRGASATGGGAVRLRVGDEDAAGLPAEFTGLGYEMSSVATPGLLSAGNRRYVRLVEGLGTAGVIRVGGIVADYSRYRAEGEGRWERQDTVVTRARVEEFAGFLRATGWRALWSVNFAQGTVEEAVEEARAVAGALGDRLLAFELGNEVENYGRGVRRFRPVGYGYGAYRVEFERWRAVLVEAVPGARFAAPDTAADVEWVERMARDAHGEVALLTTHYYRNGQRQGSAEQLMEPDAGLEAKLARLGRTAKECGIPWRMCEANSFSGGGLPGVSDTLLGALWTLDFMLLLARYGCSGVNVETGVNQLGFVSSYSPVQDDGRGLNSAGAPYYGMLAFAQARLGCDGIRAMALEGSAVGVTAYGLTKGGRVLTVVVVNRGGTDVQVEMGALGMAGAGILRLEGNGMLSGTGIRLGGSVTDEEGAWRPKKMERMRGGMVRVAGGSAVVVRG